MTASQLKVGDVVDVNFLKGKKQIASVQLSPEAWVYSDIENYNLGGVNKTASIGSSTYSLPDNAVILSDGKRSEVMDVVAQDTVTISGIGHTIYSVNVEKGHGYLRLKNEQALIGGWIEVGNSVIKEITEDMLLVVPEGSYQVTLSSGGASCTKDVVIERNKEVVLDVGDLDIVTDKTGRVLFNVTPDTATVSVDGTSVDISKAVELTYGIHQVHLEADGYESLTKYIQVGSENASISFTLEESAEEEDSISGNSLPTELTAADSEEEQDTISGNSISENTVTASTTNKVYIDAPKDVEVYLDSNYIGITPVSFKKTVGSHTISLRKSGYTTKSYTIYLYNDGEDITYSFTDLEKETTTASTSTTSSAASTTTTSAASTSSSSSGTTSATSTATSDTSTTTSDTSTTTSDTSTTTSDTSTTTSDTSTTTSDTSTVTPTTPTPEEPVVTEPETPTVAEPTPTGDSQNSDSGDSGGDAEQNNSSGDSGGSSENNGSESNVEGGENSSSESAEKTENTIEEQSIRKSIMSILRSIF
jgi:hypothetical protein